MSRRGKKSNKGESVRIKPQITPTLKLPLLSFFLRGDKSQILLIKTSLMLKVQENYSESTQIDRLWIRRTHKSQRG